MRLTVPVVLVALIGMSGVLLDAQPHQSGLAVTGVAVDASGAVLPHAQVVLTTAGTTTVVSMTAADASGTFRFASVPPGPYDVTVTFEGFQPTIVRVTVGNRPPPALRVVLPLANVMQHVTVSSQATEINTAAAANSDAVTLDQDMLASLPVFDQDYLATLSRFLDSGSMAPAAPPWW